jgi:MarR-like DNA-binding transcriptional regulator SgrR of sgrS sRNA
MRASTTKGLNKTEKIIRWASEKRVRAFHSILSEFDTTEKNFRQVLNRAQRHGFITYKINTAPRGKSVEVRLTQAAYYCRKEVVA